MTGQDGTSDQSDPRRGRPDYHDPTSGIGGAPPARSALTLRLWLAGFGLVLCIVLAVLAAQAEVSTVLVVLLALGALVAAVDLVVVIRRKRSGEPG
ncbi:DUF6343 family protein [Quadrisphaera sp. GCM10027208]|uniref:DUF6343 family protein n=1 Tax=Quadrisphaera sp. GCM10027208 TaxID=3273423 RepID=UPI00360BA0BF|nr:hypothetical protein HJG43_05865 [Kineosporiaceae bacterium SCSIO 59966]